MRSEIFSWFSGHFLKKSSKFDHWEDWESMNLWAFILGIVKIQYNFYNSICIMSMQHMLHVVYCIVGKTRLLAISGRYTNF